MVNSNLLFFLQTAQPAKSGTKQKKPPKDDNETLISDMLGGDSSQPTKLDSGWNEEFFVSKVGKEFSFNGIFFFFFFICSVIHSVITSFSLPSFIKCNKHCTLVKILPS